MAYEDEDEFNEHLKEIHLKRHIENHHKAHPEPTVEEKDVKHDNEDNDTEAKDDNSARSVKPRKPEDDNSISFKEEVYVETMKVVKCDICDLTR